MSSSNPAYCWRYRPFLFDNQKLLFSLSSYLACVLTLGIAFAACLPRPWWAILTVYVTAQPMSGAFRPKVSYRLAGILLGAAVAVAVVPNLQNSPELLVLCLATWTGFCIYLAVLDRTPRAFLFQMAGFSAAVISFPYLDDPGHIFTSAISRVEEMAVAIASVTIVHTLLQPWSVKPVIRDRVNAFLEHAASWCDGALDSRHRNLTYAARQRLAADVTEVGILATHLPFDTSNGLRTRTLVHTLQRRLAALIPLASAAGQRLDLLGGAERLAPDVLALVTRARSWLTDAHGRDIDEQAAEGQRLVDRARTLSRTYSRDSNWRALVSASLIERIAEFVEAMRDARLLAGLLGGVPGTYVGLRLEDKPLPIARNTSMAVLAGVATAAAVMLYCAIWILLAWPAGSATAAFAALITCSFATQEDPAPVIGRYLVATLITFPIAAIYMFVMLPYVDGYLELCVALAPALIGIGYIQADPARSSAALPMFSCLIVGLGFLDAFRPDFEEFVNTGIAQVMGIIITIAVTRMFRSVAVGWSVRRIIRTQWHELEMLAKARGEPDFGRWTGLALDRLGQIAGRLALVDESDVLHTADGLADIRLGRNILHLRRAAEVTHGSAAEAVDKLLGAVADLFRKRRKQGVHLDADPAVLEALDNAIAVIPTIEHDARRHQAMLAVIGMRCNLFPGIGETKVAAA
ncbi:MAG TPA: FUSC family protein [Hyphomicrobium sp.]|nr:FUSC family protein [Hyphomicrobium sp.]